VTLVDLIDMVNNFGVIGVELLLATGCGG